MTMQVNLREFANLREERVLSWLGFPVKVQVTDDFGKKAMTTTYALMLSWQGYLVHRYYPAVKFSVDSIVGAEGDKKGKTMVFNDEALAKPLEEGVEGVLSVVDDPMEADNVKRLIHIWQTKIHNLAVVMGRKSQISATSTSVAELKEDPGIIEIYNKVYNEEISIDAGEELFKVYVLNAPSLDHNIVALMARTGGVSINQAYQLAIIRANVFDLDNSILPNAILSNYAEGIVNATDALGDSRTSGKALNSNGKALKDSEWFHRRTHLATAVMRSIGHMEDCGSFDLVPVRITNFEFALSLRGKYYSQEDGTLAPISDKNITKLKTGEVFYIRSIATCNSAKHGHPCGICYGRMKAVIPYNAMMRKDANIGMFASTTICNPIGQKLLSTKHFIRNAVTMAFQPSQRDSDVISSNGNDIFLRDKICKPGTKLLLKSDIVKYLSDLRSLDSLKNINMSKVPYFQEAALIYEVEDIMMGGMTTQQHAVQISVSSRLAHFSMGFLEYIIEHGWTVEDKRSVTIDLSDWISHEPLFTLPHTREDLDVHRKRVENFLTFNTRNNTWKKQSVTAKVFGETLSEFWTLINQETKGVNIVYLEVILASLLTRDPDNLNYGLGAGPGDKYFSSFSSCIEHRDAGTLMIYESQQQTLNKAKTFMMKDRAASPLAAFFKEAVS